MKYPLIKITPAVLITLTVIVFTTTSHALTPLTQLPTVFRHLPEPEPEAPTPEPTPDLQSAPTPEPALEPTHSVELISLYVARGKMYARTNQPQKAIADFTKAIELITQYLKTSPTPSLEPTRTRTPEPKPTRTQTPKPTPKPTWKRSRSRTPTPTPTITLTPTPEVSVHIGRAERSANSREHQHAVNHYTKAIELQPNNPRWYAGRADSQWQIARHHHAGFINGYRKAVADFTKAIELEPERVMWHINRGSFYARFSEGSADFIRTNPDSNSPNAVADTFSKAVADFTKVIELEPENAKGYIARGRLYCSRALGKSNTPPESYDVATMGRWERNDNNPHSPAKEKEIVKLFQNGIADYDKGIEYNPSRTYRSESADCSEELDDYQDDLEQARQKPARQEAARQAAERQEAEQQEAERQEAVRQAAALKAYNRAAALKKYNALTGAEKVKLHLFYGSMCYGTESECSHESSTAPQPNGNLLLPENIGATPHPEIRHLTKAIELQQELFRNKADSAARLYTRRNQGEHARIYAYRGYLYCKHGETEKGIADLIRAIKIDMQEQGERTHINKYNLVRQYITSARLEYVGTSIVENNLQRSDCHSKLQKLTVAGDIADE